MSILTTIYIVRHGESVWNVQKILQGQSNSSLTRKGEQQAQNLAAKLRTVHFDAIFSSDSTRAHKTAEIIAAERKLAVRTTELLRERFFSIYEGRNYHEDEELKKVFQLYNEASAEEKRTMKHGGIESDDEIISRFIIILREIAVLYPGRTILAVSHSGIMRQFLNYLGYLTHEEMRWTAIVNTAYIKVETDGVDFFIKEVYGVTKKGTV